MPQVVKCPDCRIELDLPAVIKPGKKYSCPDCGTRLPVRGDAPRKLKLDEVERKPRKRKKPKKKPEPQPFWQTKSGKILSGVGFLVLGIAAIAYATMGDVNKPIKVIIGGVCAILLGLGGMGYGFLADNDSDSDNDDDTSGGDWDDE